MTDLSRLRDFANRIADRARQFRAAYEMTFAGELQEAADELRSELDAIDRAAAALMRRVVVSPETEPTAVSDDEKGEG